MGYTLKVGFNQGPTTLIASPGKYGIMAAPVQFQRTGTATFSLLVAFGSYALTGIAATLTGPLVRLWPDPLPAGTVGTEYNYTLTAAGGVPPYTYGVNSGTLPTGLSLNASSGLISGIPTVTVSMDAVTFSVTDSS